MSDKYYLQGFDTFDNVKNKRLKAYNRIITFLQASKEIGLDRAKDYIRQFSDEDKRDIHQLKADIKERGTAKVRRELTEG